MNERRESDPVKRAELHASRATIMGVDHLLSAARFQAVAGGSNEAAKKIQSARDDLDVALRAIVELLATN